VQEPNYASGHPLGYMMEDEIDLREYVEVMLRRWWWILGCAAAAMVTALAVSLLIPPTYEAASVLIVTEPRYQMQFDPRFETMEQWRPAYQVFPELAVSDGVLQALLQAYEPSPDAGIDIWRLRTLREMVEATSEGDPSLVKLTASSNSPADAAGLANAWAGELVVWANAIYSDGADDAEFFESQTAQAAATLERAEQALIDFQARDRASIVAAQLGSERQAQSDYLADQRMIRSLLQDIEGLRNQLTHRADEQPATLADELTSLFLQVKAFDAGAATPIQLQITTAESLAQQSRGEQAAFLGDLMETLETKSTVIEERLVELEPTILELQEELQTIRTEEARLTRAHHVAEETYVTLSRKLEEARIAAQEEKGLLQIGSYAAVPERPTSPRKTLNVAVAGALGLMAGVFGVFVWEWWDGVAVERGT